MLLLLTVFLMCIAGVWAAVENVVTIVTIPVTGLLIALFFYLYYFKDYSPEICKKNIKEKENCDCFECEYANNENQYEHSDRLLYESAMAELDEHNKNDIDMYDLSTDEGCAIYERDLANGIAR